MTLKEFIKTYDHKGNIVLLEGKRIVMEEDKTLLENLGKTLAENTKHLKFRSGNADGADAFFSKGVSEVDSERLQVITPFKGHRKKSLLTENVIALDDINLKEEPEIIAQSKLHKSTKNLIDRFVNGEPGHIALKATYIIRDTIKVIGTKSIPPIQFGLFYDDLENPMQGGTGHTMNVCKYNNVPFLTQEVWKDWVES